MEILRFVYVCVSAISTRDDILYNREVLYSLFRSRFDNNVIKLTISIATPITIKQMFQ